MSDKILTTERTKTTEARKGINELTEMVIGCAIDVHRALGPGLLKSTYEMCLSRELSLREIAFERQKPFPVAYKGLKLDCGYRADLIVENQVVVEIKSIDELTSIHDAQLLSYSETRRLENWAAHQFQRATAKTRYSPQSCRTSRRSFIVAPCSP